MKRFKKLILTTSAMLFAITLSSTVNANYQSVYKDSYSGYSGISGDIDCFNRVRNMETADNVMGLNETRNSNFTYSGDSNNIDVHMIKNTEYGAMALLSASHEYGKQPTEFDTTDKKTSRYVINGQGLKTTTGNIWGVYFEKVLDQSNSYAISVATDYASGYYLAGKDYDSRYFNIYNANGGKRINGDAMLEWHGGSLYDFRYIAGRGQRNGSIFRSMGNGYSDNKSFAVAVTGTGF